MRTAMPVFTGVRLKHVMDWIRVAMVRREGLITEHVHWGNHVVHTGIVQAGIVVQVPLNAQFHHKTSLFTALVFLDLLFG